MKYRYPVSGVCSRAVCFDMEDGVVTDVRFEGGCPGNALGLAALAAGRSAEELVEMLKDIKCGGKSTSCPAQLALALEKALSGCPAAK